MPRRPRNVIAVTPGGDLTLDHILGWFAVFAIPDAGVSATKLRRTWTTSGLNGELIPKVRKPVHAFQAACRSVETRRQEATNGHLKTHEVRVDEVLENADECVYQVTLLVRDRHQRLIDHPKGMRITFDKIADDISTEPLDKDGFEALSGSHIEDRIREHFDANANKVTGYKVREAIRHELEDVHATMIARKLYFIPKAGRDTVESLEAAIEDVYGANAEFFSVPCANDEGRKKLVAKHFGLNVAEEANRLLKEISDRLHDDDPTIRKDRLKAILDQHREMRKMAERYKDLLDMSLGEVDEKLDILNEGIEELVIKTESVAVTAT